MTVEERKKKQKQNTAYEERCVPKIDFMTNLSFYASDSWVRCYKD